MAFGFLFAGLILPNFAPKWLTMGTPWLLQQLAASFGGGQKLPPGWQVPVVATVAWTIVCLAVALWRFEREEF